MTLSAGGTGHTASSAWLNARSDERLVELAEGGFDPAFAAIVARYRVPLLQHCCRLLKRPSAEDVVQSTFIKAHEAVADGRIDSLRPWLYRVAHNAALDALRDRSLTHVALSEDLDGVERPDQAFERKEGVLRLVATVNALPPRQQSAVVQRELEGRSYAEIADRMGLSAGAVKQLLLRARTTLQSGVAAPMPASLPLRWPPETHSATTATKLTFRAR